MMLSATTFAAANRYHTVNGESYEGQYISPKPNAPLILLVHDWDGLTDW